LLGPQQSLVWQLCNTAEASSKLIQPAATRVTCTEPPRKRELNLLRGKIRALPRDELDILMRP